jgi:glutamate-1-semialdehyde aminotransferase
MERAAFCATGSEAVMAAIRLARTVTGRDRIVVFNGAYHGIFDEVLVRPARAAGLASSGESSASVGRAVPIAPGIPAAMADNIVVLEYGAPESLRAIEAMGTTVAAVLVEPVQSRRPDLQPQAFLQALRKLTADAQSALVFDEVVTGFRCHSGGAQALFGIRADLATYGKVLGGGMPIGVVAGTARFMDALDGGAWRYGDNSAPEVGVTFFAGTFVRHPLALAAARAVLTHLRESGPQLQQQLNARCQNLAAALQAEADALGVPLKVAQFSSWFHFQWTADLPFSALFYAAMRMRGIHVWEGRPCFITTAHGDAELQAITTAVRESLAELQQLGLLPAPKAAPAAANPAAAPSGVSADQPPLAGARKGRDQQGREAWFVPDPERPGKYLQVVQSMVKNV